MKLALEHSEERIFGKILRMQSRTSPDVNFLVTDDQLVTFSQAERDTNCLASGLHDLGVRAGDRIVLFLSNRPETVLMTLACNKIGAVWVPVNAEFRGAWLADTITGSKPTLIVTDDKLGSRVVEVTSDLADIRIIEVGKQNVIPQAVPYESLLSSTPLKSDYSEQSYGDTCAILWTSGTTGKSKGVVQSYNNWIRAIVEGASVHYASTADDIIYCPLPLYNSAAWITCVYRALIEGIPCVIEDKFSVSRFWERINHFGATQTFAIGAMGAFLMNSPPSPSDALTTLSTAYIVPMPPNLWTAFEQRFNLKLLSSGLGMSECLMIMNHNNCPPGTPSYSLGLPPDDIDVVLLDDNGQPVAKGDTGEICVREIEPHTIFKGYFDNPEATKLAFRDGWFLTGDLARFDVETGVYFFADRKKDAVRFAGRNISSMEVESVVRRHPAVADVAAYGIPSREIASEDELKLSVVLREGESVSEEDICEFINLNAPHFFVPRYMEFVSELPYTPTQKIQKFKLREQGNSAATWDIKRSTFVVKR